MGDYDLTYLSFGGGVQSTTLLALSALGMHGVPKADVAIFSDTKAELPDTYRHITFMSEWAAARHIRVKTVTVGDLGAQIVGDQQARQSGYQISIPAYTGGSSDGILRRQCTAHYKLDPIKATVREMLGLEPRQVAAGRFNVRALIGISLDEAIRMKPSRDSWIENLYPLVDARLTRNDCLKILKSLDIPQPVKSACFFCPYHDNSYWSWLKRERPEEFAKAVEVDRRIRNQTRAGVMKPVFLHRKREPLADVDFDAKDRGQLRLASGFGDECEGMCGV